MVIFCEKIVVRMKNVKFRGMPRTKDEFRGKFRGSNTAEKPKFRGSAQNSAARGKLWALIIMLHSRPKTIACR